MEITELEDGTSIEQMINDLEFYIDHNTKYNGKFVESIIDQFDKTGDLTQRQIDALVKIYRQNKVKEYKENL